MKRIYSSRTFLHKFLFIVPICGLLLFTTLIYSGYFEKGIFRPDPSLERIGRAELGGEDVRLMPSGVFTWTNVNKTEDIFENDKIFTGEKSEALVSLENQTKLHVLQNSLVVLQLKENLVKIDFGELRLRIADGSSIKIQSGSEIFQIEQASENSEIEISKPKGKQILVRLQKGKSVLRDVKTDTVKPLTDQRMSTKEIFVERTIATENSLPEKTFMKGDHVSKVVHPPRVHREPFLVENAGETLRRPIKFRWSTNPAFKEYRLVVRKKNQDDPVPLTVTTSEDQAIVMAPEMGEYSWYVEALDGQGKIFPSERGHLIIKNTAPLVKVSQIQHSNKMTMKTKQRINKKRAAYAHEKRQIAATQPQQSLSDPFPLSSPVKSESATTKMQGATILKSPANDSPRSYSSEVWVGAGFQTGSEVSPSTDIQSFGNTAPSSPSSAVGLKWSASPIYSAELRYDYVPSAINTEVLGSSVNSKLVGQALTADVTSRFLQSGKSRMRGVLRMQNREQQILVLSEDARLFGYKKKTQMLGIGAAYDHAYSSRLMFQGSLVFQTPFSQQTEGPKSGVDLQTPFFVEGAAGIKYNTSSRINYGLFVLGQASRTDYSQSINKQSSGAEQSLHFGGMFMIGYGLGQGNDSK